MERKAYEIIPKVFSVYYYIQLITFCQLISLVTIH
jgi:hypothetical protein